MLHLLLTTALLAAGSRSPAGPEPRPEPRAAALVDSAAARMGGAAALRRIERVRYEMMTQWQRTSFDERPYSDGPSYEWHSAIFDYTIPAWRNTRRFPGPDGKWRDITDVVRDSVAIRSMNGVWSPLNVAYVDERRELFAFAPDRVLLLAREAADLRMLPDTAIGGVAHARVAATVDRYPATLFIRRTDGLLAMARWRAAHPNDFGLVPWGEMEVELWYSRWQGTPAGVALPMQWDVRRVGRPYKRMTVLSAAFDSVAVADSFAVSDSLRAAFFVTANRPMHDLPLDSARIVEGRFATFGAFGSPAGAVKLGRRWLLLESGQAALSAERATGWIAGNDPGTEVAGALVTVPSPANGGVVELVRRGIPLHVAPGARPFVETILRNHGERLAPSAVLTRGRWLRLDGDSLWAEPVDLPDAPGALLVYVPSLRWAYSALAASPLHADRIVALLRERGWPVDRLGSLRGISRPIPPAR